MATTIETRLFITCLPADARLFAEAVQGHWSVENQLHWTLDVVFSAGFKCDCPGYLYKVACYIHLNPVKAGLAASPDTWLFSNYLDFVAEGTKPALFFSIPGVPSPRRYREFLEHRTQRQSLFSTTEE